MVVIKIVLCFFFNDTATTEIYTLSLHDALPISRPPALQRGVRTTSSRCSRMGKPDRKSTRLNSSHTVISYAVFCLKKKKDQKYSQAPMPRTTTRKPTPKGDIAL